MSDQPIVVMVDGRSFNAGLFSSEPLVRAVVVSLFTWRRAQADDPHDGELYGWWGDGHAGVQGDLIGSRLWLLSRARLDASTVSRAREYCVEALQWLVDDGVAGGVDVVAERAGMDRLSVRCVITRARGGVLDLRFDDMWGFINAV